MRFLLALLVPLLVACTVEQQADEVLASAAALRAPEDDFPYRPEPFNPAIAAAIRSSDATRVYAVAGFFDYETFQKRRTGPKILGHAILAERELSRMEGGEIAERVVTSKYLDVSSTMSCLPHPLYVIAFSGGYGDTLVVIDGCESVVIYSDASPGQPPWAHAFDPRDERSCGMCDVLHEWLPYPTD